MAFPTTSQSVWLSQVVPYNQAGLPINLALGDVGIVLPAGGGTLTIVNPTGIIAQKSYKFTFSKQLADSWNIIFSGPPDIIYAIINGTDAVLQFSGSLDGTRLLSLGA